MDFAYAANAALAAHVFTTNRNYRENKVTGDMRRPEITTSESRMPAYRHNRTSGFWARGIPAWPLTPVV